MLINYIKIALRNLRRNKLYSTVSILSLAIGLGISLLVVKFILFELSFDSFNNNSDRIYNVYVEKNFSGSTTSFSGMVPPLLPGEIQNKFPEIKYASFIYYKPTEIFKNNNIFSNPTVCYSDSNLFNIFNFKFIRGNASASLSNPNSIVLTKSLAVKYFGDINVINKTIPVRVEDKIINLKLTGIIKNIPANSSISFDAIVPKQLYSSFRHYTSVNWHGYFGYCFIKVQPFTNIEKLSAKFPSFVKSTSDNTTGKLFIKLIPLKELHFRTDIQSIFNTINFKYIYIFTIAGLLILLVSVLNFVGINLTLYSKRIREIGIRKINGAGRGELINQFLTENLLLTFISFILAVCFMELLNPVFVSFLGISASLNTLLVIYSALIITGIILIINISTSIYITFFFSSLKPDSLIKGQIESFNIRKNVRKGLIGTQFAIAIFLICCVLVFIKQMDYIKYKDLGFNKDRVLVFNWVYDLGNKEEVLINKLREYSGIKYVVGSDWFPNGKISGTGTYMVNNKPVVLYSAFVDENFIPAFQIKLMEGRNFSVKRGTDSNAVIVNEEILKIANERNPLKNGIKIGTAKWNVIGVIKDFNYMSLRDNVGPLILYHLKGRPSRIAVKIERGKIKETLSYINKVWKGLNISREIDYSFLDDSINNLYINETRLFKAAFSASVIAMIIALMGIFALSSFLIETRTKEIAIRKVLGSSVPGIVNLLSLGYIRMIILANMIAWPLAYFVMNKWLQEFAYRIYINVIIFLLAGIAVLMVTFLTISFNIIKAAYSNPIKCLRYE